VDVGVASRGPVWTRAHSDPGVPYGWKNYTMKLQKHGIRIA
jgi:hypothetical protein